MDIRKPDEWEAGDRAYCIEATHRHSVGDITRVTSLANGSYLQFGSEAFSFDPARFARILTYEEVQHLKEHVGSAELYAVYSPDGRDGWNDDSAYFAPQITGSKSHIYALKSLPEPKPEFKVGDWVMRKKDAGYNCERAPGDPFQIAEIRADGWPIDSHYKGNFGHNPKYLVHCEPPSLYDAAMQRIEAAEKELAEAKKMLHGN